MKDNERLHFESSETLEDLLKDELLNPVDEIRREYLSSENDIEQLRKTRAVLIEVPEDTPNDLIISLNPMQIRTFVIEIKTSDI